MNETRHLDARALQALATHADLYFRTYFHSTLPLHAGLVEAMCRAPHVPLQLATVLEDIGQEYLRLAAAINRELKFRNELENEPTEIDADETRIYSHLENIIARTGCVEFCDGTIVDTGKAVKSFRAAWHALALSMVIELFKNRKL